MQKKIFITTSFFLILSVLISACNLNQAPTQQPTEEDIFFPLVQEPVDQQDLFPQKVQVNHAQGFTIEYFDTYKRLTVLQPWMAADQTFTYILVPPGGSPPSDTQGALVINTPIKNIVTMSTTYFSFLEQIDKLDTIIAVDDVTYVFNPTIRQMAQNDQLAIVGGGAGGGTVNLEMLINLSPDLIMTSASGTPELDAHPKLIEAGLPVVINGDYLEHTPLGRAEWGKFIAAFYDLEFLAAQQFDQIEANYQALVQRVSEISQKPTVFTNTDFQGSWYVPAGESYAAILLRDAGADYLWSEIEGNGAIPLSFEAVVEQAETADFWLNVGFAADLNSLLMMDERYTLFTAFANAQVYNYNKRMTENGGMDYFESGVAYPDRILSDLVAIFHPEILPDHELYYYQKLD